MSNTADTQPARRARGDRRRWTIVIGVAVLTGFSAWDLWRALTTGTIYARHIGQITRETYPVHFWFTVAMLCCWIIFVVIVAFVLAARAIRRTSD